MYLIIQLFTTHKMVRFVLFLTIILFPYQRLLSQTIHPENLKKEISALNDDHKYKESIIRLEDIIQNKNATAYDKFHAYLQKSLTYKRLYNYSEAKNNLDAAEVEGRKSTHPDEAEIRCLIENIFISFDLQENDRLNQLISKVDKNKLKFIDPETQAIYISVLSIIEIRQKNYKAGDQYLDEAIAILKNHNPKHLPNIYRKKVVLYGELNDEKKALEAFQTGLFYAQKYKTDIYVIHMYETLTKYYTEKDDYKNAFFTQQKVSELRTKYNAANESGKLTILEKEIIQKRNQLEVQNEKNLKIFFSILALILAVLFFVFHKLYKTNLQKTELLDNEYRRMRDELANINLQKEVQPSHKKDLSKYDLTPRQLEIIHLVEQGKTNKEIGFELHISENTVKYHLKAIFNILEIDNRASLK